MTQQTKTVEMVARECAESVLLHLPITGLTNHDFEEAAETIRQAISDAVKGSGAVEALESVELYESYAGKDGHRDWAHSASMWLYPDEAVANVDEKKVIGALAALKALTLPDHAERGTKT